MQAQLIRPSCPLTIKQAQLHTDRKCNKFLLQGWRRTQKRRVVQYTAGGGGIYIFLLLGCKPSNQGGKLFISKLIFHLSKEMKKNLIKWHDILRENIFPHVGALSLV